MKLKHFSSCMVLEILLYLHIILSELFWLYEQKRFDSIIFENTTFYLTILTARGKFWQIVWLIMLLYSNGYVSTRQWMYVLTDHAKSYQWAHYHVKRDRHKKKRQVINMIFYNIFSLYSTTLFKEKNIQWFFKAM